ncbi:PREDICTED: uncharacterized protein LOC106742341, partial [Dinoponera quadriceps]|uniref:Uncharacterized protein LOC106742341 n=1 Tax=Dinoponera quadriceps TaxID=609295 RepID=A0A6P3WX24_DINQU
MCPNPLDGPGGVLAHTSFPNGDDDYVTEVNVDRAESWHVHISKNSLRTHSLLYVIAHEIGHTLDNFIYVVSYPSYKLIRKLSFNDFGLPPTARINTAINTNKGRRFIVYNDHIVGEIDDCSTRIMNHRSIDEIFPGIPTGMTTAFRYTDGNLYFVKNHFYYKFNDFVKLITAT